MLAAGSARRYVDTWICRVPKTPDLPAPSIPPDPALATLAALLACAIVTTVLWIRTRRRARRLEAERIDLQTRRDAAERAARHWEAHLRAVLADMPQAILLCDDEGRPIAESGAGALRDLRRRPKLGDRLREARGIGGALVVVERAPDGLPVRLIHHPLSTGGFLVIEEPVADATTASLAAV